MSAPASPHAPEPRSPTPQWPVVLQEATIYAADAALLRARGWLNDSLLSFAGQHLQHRVHAGDQALLFVAPGAVQVLQFEEDADDLRASVLGLGLAGRRVVFLPVNDCTDLERTEAGGTHWSLLVWVACFQAFLHFDSHDDANEMVARAVSTRVGAALGCASPRFVSVPCAQQRNGYDCGVYVCLFMELVAPLAAREYASVAEQVATLASAVHAATVSAASIAAHRAELLRRIGAVAA